MVPWVKSSLIYFLTGGIFTVLIVALEENGSRLPSGFATLMPVFTLVAYNRRLDGYQHAVLAIPIAPSTFDPAGSRFTSPFVQTEIIIGVQIADAQGAYRTR